MEIIRPARNGGAVEVKEPEFEPPRLQRQVSVSDDNARIFEEFEFLIDVFYRFSNNSFIPINSSEANLMKLIACYKVKCMAPHKFRLLDFGTSEDFERGITQLRENLFRSLEDEGFLNANAPWLRNLKRCIENISANGEQCYSEDLQKNEYFKLLNILRPLDLNRLRILLDKAKKAENDVKGRKVILLIGNTGAGKSTLTHHLCGSTFRPFDKGVIPDTIGPIAALESVHIGRSTTLSETRYVSAIPVQFRVRGILETFYICDTPGFLDVRGAEIELANVQGIVDAIKNAAEVYPVLLFNEGCTADKWGAFRSMLKTVAAFIPTAASNLGAFSYIFTKGWTIDDRKAINDALQEIINNLPQADAADTAYVALLDDICSKTHPELGWAKAFILNPLLQTPPKDTLLYAILSHQAKPITNCAYNFTYIRTDKSTEILRKECDVLEHVIKHLSDPKHFNFQLINYHFSLMKVINKAIPNSPLEESVINCKELVSSALITYIEEHKSKLVSKLFGTTLFSTPDEVREVEETCTEFLKCLDLLDSARNALKEHLDDFDEFPNRPSQLDEVEKIFKSQVLDLLTASRFNEIDFRILRARLDRLKIAAAAFGGESNWHSLVGNSIAQLQSLFENCFASINNAVIAWKIPECSIAFKVLKEAEIVLRDYLNLSKVSYDRAKELLKEAIVKKTQELDELWGDSLFLNGSQPAGLEKVARDLEIVMKDTILREHYLNASIGGGEPLFELESIHNVFLEKVLNYVRRVIDSIKENIAKGGSALSTIKGKYDQIRRIQEIPSLINFPKMSEVYRLDNMAKDHLGQFILNMIRETNDSLQLLIEQRTTVDSNVILSSCLRNLAGAKWLADVRETEYKDIDKVKSEIDKAYRGLCSKARASRLFYFSQEEEISFVAHLRLQLENSDCLREFLLPEVKDSIEEAKRCLKTYRVDVLSAIQAFVPTTIDLALKTEQLIKVEEILTIRSYFNISQKYGQLDCGENDVRKSFDGFVSSYIEAIHGQISQMFTRITSFDCSNTSIEYQEQLQHASNLIFCRVRELKLLFDASIDKEKFDYWCERFDTGFVGHLQKLERELLSHLRNKDLAAYVKGSNVAQYLMIIDPFLTARVSKRFGEVGLQYFNALNDVGNNLDKYITEAIKRHDFLAAAQNIKRLRDAGDTAAKNQSKAALSLLAVEVMNLRISVLEDCYKIERYQDISRMDGLVATLKLLERAIEDTGDLLEEKLRKSVGEEFRVEAATILYAFVRKQKKMKHYLVISNFVEIEQRKQQIQNFLTYLKEGKLTERRCADGSVCVIDCDQIMLGVEKEIKSFFEDLEKKFNAIEDISELFTLNPAVVIQNLSSPQLPPSEYPIYRVKVVNALVAKIKSRVDLIKESSNSMEEKLRDLQSLNTIVERTCPNEVIGQVKILVEKYSLHMMDNHRQFIQSVDQDLRSPNCNAEHLHSSWLKAKKGGHSDAINKISESFDLEIKSLCVQIKQDVCDLNKIKSGITAFQRLHELKMAKVEEIVPSLKSDYERIVQTLISCIQSSLSYFMFEDADDFTNSSFEPKSDFPIIPASHGYKIIIEFIQAELFQLLFPTADLLPQIGGSIDKVNLHVEALKKNFLEGLDGYNIHLILSTYNKMKDVDALVMNLRNMAEKKTFETMGNLWSVKSNTPDRKRLSSLSRICSTLWTFRDANEEIKKRAPTIEDIKKSLDRAKEKAANHQHRQTIYSTIDKQLQFLMNLRNKAKEFNLPRDFLSTEVDALLTLIVSTITAFRESLRLLVNPTDSCLKPLSNESVDSFQREFDHIQVIKDAFTFQEIKLCARQVSEEVYSTVLARIQQSETTTQTFRLELSTKPQPVQEDYKLLTDALLVLFQTQQLHEEFSSQVNQKLQSILQSLTANEAFLLSEILKKSPEGYNIILSFSSIFEAVINKLRQQATQGMNSTLALTLLEGKDYRKDRMEVAYKKNEAVFNQLTNTAVLNLLRTKQEIEDYIQSKIINKVYDIKREIIDPSRYLTSSLGYVAWNKQIRDVAVGLVPYVFALKTLDSTGFSWLPHSVQVLSILRLLRADFDERKWANLAKESTGFTGLDHHLLQIGTGEGKSITLSVAACIFALLGYDVNVACYSQYLSRRDEEGARALFERFGLNIKAEDQRDAARVKYGTFQQLAEDFINENGTIRTRIECLVRNKLPPAVKSPKPRPRILLIDEVDVFLDPSFYVKSYNPVGSLSYVAIQDVVQYIWNESKNKDFSFEKVKGTSQFSAMLQHFPSWESFLTKEVREMISGVEQVRNGTFHKPYYFDEKSCAIGYKRNDSITYNLSYGYETLFLYYKECESKNLSMDIAREKSVIHLDCGHFLFTELCKAFVGVFGVTGTLKVLTNKQRESLDKVFKITCESFIPSAYGDRNNGRFIFTPNSRKDLIIIEEEAEFNLALVQQIESRIRGEDGGLRAILVFFSSEPQLQSFCETYLKSLEERLGATVQTMTSGDTDYERNQTIRKAVVPGTITLAERDFGRGTDFVCYDEKLNSRGGVHVIQTFFSEEKAEEIQIQGRTARATNNGSYSMVIPGTNLINPLGLKKEEVTVIRNSETPYDQLHTAREKKSNEELERKLTIDQKSIDTHTHSMELKTADRVKYLRYLEYLSSQGLA